MPAAEVVVIVIDAVLVHALFGVILGTVRVGSPINCAQKVDDNRTTRAPNRSTKHGESQTATTILPTTIPAITIPPTVGGKGLIIFGAQGKPLIELI